MLAISLVVFVVSAVAQYDLSSCLYAQTFSFFDGVSAYNYNEYGYSYRVSWLIQQQNIVNSSFVLSGFQMANSVLFDYDAGIQNVTSSGAQFIYNPMQNSEIVRVTFTLVLAKFCKGFIQLQLIDFIPDIFTQAGRIINTTNYDVKVLTPFRSDTNSYQSEAMVSAYRLEQAIGQTELEFTVKSIIPGQDYQTIQIYSPVGLSNIYSRISFTYILIDVSTFGNQISYYNNRLVKQPPYTNMTGNDNIEIPRQFNPYLAQKCIIGIKWIWMHGSGPPFYLFLNNTGTSIISNFSIISQRRQIGIMFSRYCLQSCLLNYYVEYNTSTYICSPCSMLVSHCKICQTHINCSSCAASYFLYQNQCYLTCPSGFYANTTNSICVNLTNSSIYTFLNGQCTCKQPGFNLISNLCTNIIGCLTAILISNQTVCKACNITANYILTSDLKCICMNEYYAFGGKCVERCGDGRLFSLECDDGNTINGDGCSSSCTIEKYYQCVNGSNATASKCIYHPTNIKLYATRIDKRDTQNVGIFTFQITPFIMNMEKLNLTRDFIFSCNQLVSIRSIIMSSTGQVKVQMQFMEDLQGNDANITIMLGNLYFVQEFIIYTFKMASNGIKLVVIKNMLRFIQVKLAYFSFSIIIISIFAISIIFHKMVGVQLIHTFQVIYLVHINNQNYTNVYSLIKNLCFCAFDFLSFTNNYINLKTYKQNITYSSQNRRFALLVMEGITFLSLCIFIIAIIKKIFIHQQSSKKLPQKQNQQIKNILKFFNKILKVTYNNFIFPFIMGMFFIFFLVSNTSKDSDKFLNQIQCLEMVIISLVFFYQWKSLVCKCKDKKYVGLPRCKPKYISIYLTFMMATAIIINISYCYQLFFPQKLLTGLYILAFIVFLFNLPYQNSLNNIGILLNLITVIYFLIWSNLKSSNSISQGEDTQILIIFILALLIACILIITTLRIIFQFKRKFLQNENQQKSNQINLKTFQEVEKKERQYMSKLKNQSFKQIREKQSIIPHISKIQKKNSKNDKRFKKYIKTQIDKKQKVPYAQYLADSLL